jgi:hypothetical protein
MLTNPFAAALTISSQNTLALALLGNAIIEQIMIAGVSMDFFIIFFSYGL